MEEVVAKVKSNNDHETTVKDKEAIRDASYKLLTRLSPEIRTPLNTIIGLAELAKGRVDDPEYIEYCLNKIDISAKQLLNLVNEVLDISNHTVSNHVLREESTDFYELMQDIVRNIRVTTNDKKINFRDDIQSDLAAGYVIDAGRVRQMLINILANAVKFTPRYGTIHFYVRRLSSDGQRDVLEFVISDTGIGISPEFLPHVFEMFEQEYDGNTTVYGGTGLGLAVSKNIVTMMNGDISVTSQKGEGTEFRIKLALKLSPSLGKKDMNKGMRRPFDFSNHRVLLVEDNEVNCMIARQMLERRGMEVYVAEHGRAALDQYMMNPPGFFDLIIMDVRMPYMDGLTATKKIRMSGKTDCKDIPIIAMTANAMVDDVEKSREAGMCAHIAKPINPRMLYNAIQRALDGTVVI